ncbi:protein Flattop [Suncus etruscus]|uniref:protein Flattop n=1 Tax=Suncus etruscus TaxID=109475 RepID=UPI002110B57B|nr:protein Flattop [Suncus etruscus]
MAANYSANQYEKAYRPVHLQNWSPARRTKERVTAKEGYTQTIADDRGHLLPSVPRSQASPWGSFMGTWQMPLKMPPARVNLTSRSAAGAANLTKRIQDNPDFLKACNGPRPEILGKLREPEWPGPTLKTEPQAPSPARTPSSRTPGSVSGEVPRSRHPSAGHTPRPPAAERTVASPLPGYFPANTSGPEGLSTMPVRGASAMPVPEPTEVGMQPDPQ